MCEVMLDLAATGVDVLRLDAVPFLWKRVGTNLQNQPEVHQLAGVPRGGPDRGARRRVQGRGRSCRRRTSSATSAPAATRARLSDLAYHNVLMVLLWSLLATRKVALMTRTLQSMPPVPAGAGWVTMSAATTTSAGRSPRRTPRRWERPASSTGASSSTSTPATSARSRAARFQENDATGDARTSGTAVSLAGLEAGDEHAVERLLLLYAVAFAYGGLPLIYMGDELGLLNDRDWAADPMHASDNRWMHRPPMDWEAARRNDPVTVEGRLWAGLQRLIERAPRDARCMPRARSRRSGPATTTPGLRREHAGDRQLLLLANFSPEPQTVALDGVERALQPYDVPGWSTRGAGQRRDAPNAANSAERHRERQAWPTVAPSSRRALRARCMRQRAM